MASSRATVEDCARSALAALNCEAGIILAAQWVSERFAQIASRTGLRSLRRTATLTVPAVITAGTVTATQGSPTVTGDATAAAAWGASDLRGHRVQVASAIVWYTVADVSGTTLTLTAPYTEASVAAAGYRIVQQAFTLASDVRRLGSFLWARQHRRLREASLADLDHGNPERLYTTGGPWVVVELGVDAAGVKTVELYPYTTTPETLTYRYLAAPPTLELRDVLPGSLDLYQLKEGVLIDVMKYQAASCAQKLDYNGAAYWRNEYRAQETAWEDQVRQAISQDRGMDNTEVWLRSAIGGMGEDGRHWITNARDQVWSTGP